MIEKLHGMEERDRTILKLTLKGHLSLPVKARLDEALAEYREIFAGFEVWDCHTDLVVLSDNLDMDDLDLSGFHSSS